MRVAKPQATIDRDHLPVNLSMSTPASTPKADGGWTIRRVLEWTSGYLREKGSDSPRLEAEVLLAHARGCPRIQLYTAYDEVLPETIRSTMRELVQRRAAAEPVAYLVGHREFFGLKFRVSPDVLIPRPETETLVMETLERTKSLERPRLLDLGTGSGCVAVAIAVNHPGAQVTAIDISPAALAVARSNVEQHGVADRVELIESDLFAGVAAGTQFDAIVSNPPYVRIDEMDGLPPEIRLHEPQLALVAGPEGLDVFRRIAAEAPRWLTPGGFVLVEFSPEQAARVQGLFTPEFGWRQNRILNDNSGQPRALYAETSSV
jgi:release factor glutamine methyltransferase